MGIDYRTYLLCIYLLGVVFGQQKSIQMGMVRNVRTLQNTNNYQQNKGIKKSLENILNIHYDLQLFVGDNKEKFKVILDSGSTQLWIASSNCTGCAGVGIWKTYSCQVSKTCEFLDQSEIDIQYGVGRVFGFPVNEVIYLGENSPKGVNMNFLLVNRLEDLPKFKSLGILGMGRKDLKQQSGTIFETTFLQYLKQANLIETRRYSLTLAGQFCSQSSNITIGEIDRDSLADGADIVYVPVSTPDYWSVQVQNGGMKLGSEELLFSFDSYSAVIDSGTTKITFGTKDIQLLIEKFSKMDLECTREVEQSGGINHITCLEYRTEKYPDIWINLENYSFVLSPRDYINGCTLGFSGIKCALNIQQIDIEKGNRQYNFIILGELFMKNYVVVFDQENEQVGFGINKFAKYYDATQNDLLFKLFFKASLIILFVIFAQILGYTLGLRVLNKELKVAINGNFKDLAETETNRDSNREGAGDQIEMSQNTQESVGSVNSEDIPGDGNQIIDLTPGSRGPNSPNSPNSPGSPTNQQKEEDDNQ